MGSGLPFLPFERGGNARRVQKAGKAGLTPIPTDDPTVLLFIDHFDSFTYNLVQAFEALGEEVITLRSHDHLEELLPKANGLILGPGPGSPGPFPDWALRKVPVLGICLGHQMLAEHFGGKVGRAPRIMHGKTSPIHHDGRGLFSGLPQGFEATRYHSLTVTELPPGFEVSARTSEGEIMAMRHTELPIASVQFHPESIATRDGPSLLANFLNLEFIA